MSVFPGLFGRFSARRHLLRQVTSIPAWRWTSRLWSPSLSATTLSPSLISIRHWRLELHLSSTTTSLSSDVGYFRLCLLSFKELSMLPSASAWRNFCRTFGHSPSFNAAMSLLTLTPTTSNSSGCLYHRSYSVSDAPDCARRLLARRLRLVRHLLDVESSWSPSPALNADVV